jgi:hypothetical protein
MNRTEWISAVIVDLHETFDLWRVSESASRLAHRWWRLAHPLVWDTDWASEGMICFPPELAGMTFDEAVAASQDIPEDLF